MNEFDYDKKVANDTFEQLIEALESNNKNAVKQLFSSNTVREISDFDTCISKLIDFYNGEMISYELFAHGVDERMHYGEYQKIGKCSYNLETTKQSYRFAIEECITDNTDDKNIGIISLYIIRAEDTDTRFSYWGESDWIPGIHIET